MVGFALKVSILVQIFSLRLCLIGEINGGIEGGEGMVEG